MALFVLLGALFWVQRFVFGFCYFVPVFVFVLLGPGAQLSSLVFLPTPALPLQVSEEGGVRVDRGGGLEKGSLAGEVGGEGGFCFSFV